MYVDVVHAHESLASKDGPSIVPLQGTIYIFSGFP